MPDPKYSYDGQDDANHILEEILHRSRASGETIFQITSFLEKVNKREAARKVELDKRAKAIQKQRRIYNKEQRDKKKAEKEAAEKAVAAAEKEDA